MTKIIQKLQLRNNRQYKKELHKKFNKNSKI